MTAYHNTNRLSGPQLAEAEQKAATQKERILRLFERLHEGQGLAPSKVHRLVGGASPITSTRRAIPDLTDAGHLIKTIDTVPGPHGKPEHVWVKSADNGQTNLFGVAA